MRPFIEVRRIGYVDDNERAKGYTEFRGKIIADRDHPLALVAGVLEMVIDFASWSSFDAAKKDLASLKRQIQKLDTRYLSRPPRQKSVKPKAKTRKRSA